MHADQLAARRVRELRSVGGAHDAGGRQELGLGPDDVDQLEVVAGTLSWLIVPLGSTTTPRKYFAGLTGRVTAVPVMVTTFCGWLMIAAQTSCSSPGSVPERPRGCC